ncbi:MAG: carboxypeptidase regulatory-like domain-containing protein [Bacteroidetes bacterium]|nr:carboxypeptidase regulatory-like domain-containing protein [Bacteroidota bacterium]
MFKKALLYISVLLLFTVSANAQGLTTAFVNGIVSDTEGNSLPGANIIAVHIPTGTQYGASSRESGLYNLSNLRVGGPYSVTVSFVGYDKSAQENLYLKLGEKLRLDFTLKSQSVELESIIVSAKADDVLNSNRTGAATFIRPEEIKALPSIKRSTRDITRLDPRSDGNFSFGGKNWLFNNISVDGSYFNNPFGLDDPAPGGQANAEPIPFDAVEQVQVSIAPFDVREGGFTGAGINTVTKSGTNAYKGSIYSFVRNESLLGNKVSGQKVVANPDLSFNQSGFSVSGPIIPNTLFFFLNAEIERREDPGSNFIADRDGIITFGESRVDAATMDLIRQRMIDVYGYDPGPYEGYIHETSNEKLLLKLDWNINEKNNLTFRYNYLDARRDLGPHPFVLSVGGTGRGPNSSSLPFKNSGYTINNQLNSFALELNSRYPNFANKFFASYNQFRDFREPFSSDFPTIEIGENGVTYTTVGQEPFSIHNILDQDVWQFTNNFSYYYKSHVFTVGSTFEYYKFFNSFNIFRHGLFMLDASWAEFLGGTTFSSLADFFARTDPNDPANKYDFRSKIGTGPYKGEYIEVAQLSFYAQDEYLHSDKLSFTFGLRVDVPMYITEPVDNPFSRGLNLIDENDNPETIDQSKLPPAIPLFSPRVGFNWDVTGDRSTQVRGGTGIFTGRIPFVWYGNNISNPGANPKLYPAAGVEQIETQDNSILQQSYDLNAMVDDFKWPQVWTTNLAVDQKLPWDMLGTVEFLYGKDLNSIYVRNGDLVKPAKYLADGRPYFGGAGNNELNAAYPGEGAGAYIIDNSDEGYNYSLTTQLRKQFDFGLNTTVSYTFTEAKSLLKSTEIASVLWAENPIQGDPNKPVLSNSEFGHRHRFIAGATYKHTWDDMFATTFGVFMEAAEGNRFAGAGGNRYSFTYSGDVNGDGMGGNDLIYIPNNSSEINFQDYVDGSGATVTAAQQWTAFDAFMRQDDYLSENRGKIAERFGAVNPWYTNIDLRILQDISLLMGGRRHTFQLSLDILNFANMVSSDFGVREVASSAATTPLELVGWDAGGEPIFNFDTTLKETYTDDPGLFSRWQMQVGLKYFFE